MPDASYPDLDVDAVYAQMDDILADAKNRKRKCVLCGDLNAQVGHPTSMDDHNILGAFSLTPRNNRGEMLLQWCTLHGLVISNTFFDTVEGNLWTYQNGNFRSQLDFILVDTWLFPRVADCRVFDNLDIGSDHRCIIATIRCDIEEAPRKRASHNHKKWHPDKALYSQCLERWLPEFAEVNGAEAKLLHIEKTLVAASVEAHTTASTFTNKKKSEHRKELDDLISQRRNLRLTVDASHAELGLQRKSVCKRIQNLLKRERQQKQTQRIRDVLSEFRDLKSIPRIKGTTKAHKFAEMQSSEGTLVTEKTQIVEVFAAFYETLFRSRAEKSAHGCDPGSPWTMSCQVEAFSMDDLRHALKTMKCGKARDQAGLVAEMLKDGTAGLLEMVLEVFNDILLLRETCPQSWKETKITVIFKKGDTKMPGNYRPIAILPILYKVFSKMLCNRLSETLVAAQDVDQAAYRKGFSTDDHLLTVSLLIERSHEFNSPLWLGLVDFEKAFDSIEFDALWHVLEKQGVSQHYIALLKGLYAGQTAFVRTNTDSRKFEIGRGVKQGDPISALFFIAVMQDLCSILKIKWSLANKRRCGQWFGVRTGGGGPEETLTNLRFADDVLLIAQSCVDMQKMLNDFATQASKYGLRLNFDKTRILTWDHLAAGRTHILAGGSHVRILKENESEKYLGRKLSLGYHHAVELRNRISAAWAAFHKHKAELCSKFYPVRDRARLFDAVVTSALLYGCAAWALTKSQCTEIDTLRRKMLRYVFRIHRRRSSPNEESWADYLHRSARRVDEMSAMLSMETWSTTYRRRKWRFAGTVARQSDGRWSQHMLYWRPCGGRDRGRPRTRWADEIVRLAGDGWAQAATDQTLWKLLEDGFATQAA
jgi:hypothetical protein